MDGPIQINCAKCIINDMASCSAQTGEPSIVSLILFPVFLGSLLLLMFLGSKYA